jgi:hypothetical protein
MSVVKQERGCPDWTFGLPFGLPGSGHLVRRQQRESADPHQMACGVWILPGSRGGVQEVETGVAQGACDKKTARVVVRSTKRSWCE